MQKLDLPVLILGFLLTATTTSCRTIIDANGQATVEPELAITAVTLDVATVEIALDPTDTAEPPEITTVPVSAYPGTGK
ncbi:MAG: hypothetical protein R3C44_24295 [Chloroflexota bacterium]